MLAGSWLTRTAASAEMRSPAPDDRRDRFATTAATAAGDCVLPDAVVETFPRLLRAEGVARSHGCWRGEPIAALAGVPTAEAIVPAVEPDHRYPGIARREATDVAASRCRRTTRPAPGGSAGECDRHRGRLEERRRRGDAVVSHGNNTQSAEAAGTSSRIEAAVSSALSLSWDQRQANLRRQFPGLCEDRPEGIRPPDLWLLDDGPWWQTDGGFIGFQYVPSSRARAMTCPVMAWSASARVKVPGRSGW